MDETPEESNIVMADEVEHNVIEPTSKQSKTSNVATSRDKGEPDAIIVTLPVPASLLSTMHNPPLSLEIKYKIWSNKPWKFLLNVNVKRMSNSGSPCRISYHPVLHPWCRTTSKHSIDLDVYPWCCCCTCTSTSTTICTCVSWPSTTTLSPYSTSSSIFTTTFLTSTIIACSRLTMMSINLSIFKPIFAYEKMGRNWNVDCNLANSI